MLHAFRNAFRVIEQDDLTMFIGADQTGQLLEIGISDTEPATIVHAMKARPKYLR